MNQKMETLKAKQKQIQMLGLGAIGLLVVALITLFLKPVATTVVFGAEILLYLFLLRPRMKEYGKLYKVYNVEESLGSSLKKVQYAQKDQITEADISACLMDGDEVKNFMALEAAHAEYQMLPVVISDFSVAIEKHMPGQTKKAYGSISGIACLAELKEDSGEHLLIRSSEIEGMTDHEELKKQLLSLKKYTPGTISFRLDGRKLQLLIENRFLCTRTIPVKAELTPQVLQYEQFPEVHNFLRIIDSVK